MKLAELLFEVEEIIERHGNYGQWIDTRNSKIYPVKSRMGHAQVLIDNPHLVDMHPREAETTNVVDLMRAAFNVGLVRVIHDSPESVGFSGYSDFLKQIVNIRRKTSAQDDVNSIYIEVLGNDSKSKMFPRLLKHPSEIVDYINQL